MKANSEGGKLHRLVDKGRFGKFNFFKLLCKVIVLNVKQKEKYQMPER
jgi:hypothetical protein